jgi:hypothetical protein
MSTMLNGQQTDERQFNADIARLVNGGARRRRSSRPRSRGDVLAILATSLDYDVFRKVLRGNTFAA